MSNTNLKLVQEPKPKKNGSGNHPFERTTRYLVPPEQLVIVGLDIEDDGSVLNDERLTLPLDEDMIDSIMRHGVKKDILCRKNNATGKYEVADGRQRTVNAREANRRLREMGGRSLVQVPVRVDKGDDDLMFELQIVLNRHVESTPLMKARTAKRFHDRCGSKAETCRVCHISESTFNGWMDLLQMDKSVHNAVDAGKISSSQALKFSKLSRSRQQKAVEALISMEPDKRRPILPPKNKTDAQHMPSKAALLTIIMQGEDSLDPNFVLGLKYALGQVKVEDVPGLAEVKGVK